MHIIAILSYCNMFYTYMYIYIYIYIMYGIIIIVINMIVYIYIYIYVCMCIRNGLYGGLASSIGITVMNPVDVVKTRLQMARRAEATMC